MCGRTWLSVSCSGISGEKWRDAGWHSRSKALNHRGNRHRWVVVNAITSTQALPVDTRQAMAVPACVNWSVPRDMPIHSDWIICIDRQNPRPLSRFSFFNTRCGRGSPLLSPSLCSCRKVGSMCRCMSWGASDRLDGAWLVFVGLVERRSPLLFFFRIVHLKPRVPGIAA